MIEIGSRFRYLGDHAPFSSSFLGKKDAKAGEWPLPWFTDDIGPERKWKGVPHAAEAELTLQVVDIETGRKDKHRGTPLPDLYILERVLGPRVVRPRTFDGLFGTAKWRAGLLAEDLLSAAKFSRVDDDVIIEDNDLEPPLPPEKIAERYTGRADFGAF